MASYDVASNIYVALVTGDSDSESDSDSGSDDDEDLNAADLEPDVEPLARSGSRSPSPAHLLANDVFKFGEDTSSAGYVELEAADVLDLLHSTESITVRRGEMAASAAPRMVVDAAEVLKAHKAGRVTST